MHCSLIDLTPCYMKTDGYVFNPCRTARILKCNDSRSGQLLNGVAEVTFELPTNWGNKAIITSQRGEAVKWGSPPEVKYQYMEGQRRLLLRMLPLKVSKPKKGYPAQADCHLWPKGTFCRLMESRCHLSILCSESDNLMIYQNGRECVLHWTWLHL